MREVVPRLLWLGNAPEARDIKRVLNLGVAAVVDLAIEEPPIQFPRDVVYCRFPLIDGEGNPPELIRTAFATVRRFIESRTPVLVACSGGMSRSPAITAAAIAQIEGEDMESILHRLAAAGPHDVSATLWSDILTAAKADP